MSVGKCFHTEIQISKYKSSLALFPSLSRSGFSYFFGKQDNTTTAKNDKFKVLPPGPPHICSGRDRDGDSPERYFLVFSAITTIEIDYTVMFVLSNQKEHKKSVFYRDRHIIVPKQLGSGTLVEKLKLLLRQLLMKLH